MRQAIKTVPKKTALNGTDLDWERGLCNQGCQEWIPWYRNKRGKLIRGCRLGLIPHRVNGQWQCHHRRPIKRKGRVYAQEDTSPQKSNP